MTHSTSLVVWVFVVCFFVFTFIDVGRLCSRLLQVELLSIHALHTPAQAALWGWFEPHWGLLWRVPDSLFVSIARVGDGVDRSSVEGLRERAFSLLDESLQMLRLVSLRAPCEGLQALSDAQRLLLLCAQLSSLAMALRGRVPEGKASDLHCLLELCDGAGPFDVGLPDSLWALGAFVRRQEELARWPLQRTQTTELAPLCDSLLRAVRRLQKEVQQHSLLSEQVSMRARRWVRFKRWSPLIVAMACLFLYLGYVSQRLWQPIPPRYLSLPTTKVPGVKVKFRGRAVWRHQRFRTYRERQLYWADLGHFGPASEDAWRGLLYIPITGSYKICTRINGSIQIQIGNRQVTSPLHQSWNKTDCGALTLAHGWHPISVLMKQGRWPARLLLYWRTPYSRRFEYIPPRYFCCQKRI